MTREEKVRKYLELQEQEERIKEEKDALKLDILDDMGSENKFTTSDGIIAQITEKKTIKYNDEVAMIKWLKENGHNNYIVEKINTTSFNKDLKKSVTLTESLGSMFTENTSYALSVKRG